jgi:hypothetical protein
LRPDARLGFVDEYAPLATRATSQESGTGSAK